MWLLIAAANGACVRAGGEDIPLSAVIELINSIKKERNHALESGLLHVLYRIFDMSIIGDVKIQRLVRYWDAVSPYADEKIRERLIELLGQEPSEEYVRYLRKCLASAREGRSDHKHLERLRPLLDQYAQQSATKELRCAICGFHFREKDLGAERLRLAHRYGLKLAKYLVQGRATDPWKPVALQRKAHPTSGETLLTAMEIDHIIPREGFGWNDVDNLQIVCKYCNEGKMNFRFALEPISTIAGGLLADVPANRPFNKLQQVSAVAALRSQGGSCYSCGSTKVQTELTVTAAKPEQDQMLYGCAPWNLRSTCYSCASADVIESAGARPAQVDTTFLLENAPADDDLA